MRSVNGAAHGDSPTKGEEAVPPEEQAVWLRLVLDWTDSQLWSVDVDARILRVHAAERRAERVAVYENFPDSYLESGLVHPSSQEAFRRFALALLSGKRADSGHFVLRYRETNCFGWTQLSYRTLSDAQGRPVKAVGLRTNLSYRSSGKAGFLQRRPAPENLYPHLFGNVQANLTTDFVERLQTLDEGASSLARYGSYTSVVDLAATCLFSEDDEPALRRRFGRESLLDAFDHGRRWEISRLRLVDCEGTIRWLQAAANMVRDPESADVLLFGYLSCVDLQRRWESLLDAEPSRDPGTGVYGLATLRALAKAIPVERPDAVCAVAIVRVEGAHDEEAADPDFARSHGRDIEAALAFSLGGDCAVGRLRPGAVAAYFPEAVSRQEMRRRVERAVSFARISLDDLHGMSALRFVSGVVCADAGETDFDALVRQAESLCDLGGGDAQDVVVIPDARIDRPPAAGLPADGGGETVLSPWRAGQGLSASEQETALACLSKMLDAESFEASADAFLACVGSHCRADRAYLLAFPEDGRAITVPYEWCAPGKYGIRQIISGKSIDQYPLLARCAESSRPQLLSRAGDPASGGVPSVPPWRFAVYPLGSEDSLRWMLAIENPREATEDTALLDFLVPRLNGERRRLRRRSLPAGLEKSMDRLMGLPSLRSFMDGVYSFSSDQYSAMGALAVDVPELSAISEREGFERAMRLLLRVSDVLADLFGSDLLYHTRDGEFVVLSPDTVHEAFVDRCARARLLLQTDFPGSVRMGYTWSDGAFSARTLVQEAQSIMRCDDAVSSGALAGRPAFSPGRLREGERFVVYLQPKADLRTGAVVGAEALARVIDANGQVISPAAFVEAMEREGTVRDLDYFVFDGVLAAMDGWIERGLRLIPVSSNFSRATLLTPSSFASVMAIMSRYPNIPQGFVELEVTETACNVEKATLDRIVGRFRELGVRMGLDDFGSDYSSLSVLANVPFDSVKIDRSLVSGLSSNGVARMLVGNIANVCKSRGMDCIAEGVETKEQIRALIEAGCNTAQGYYYGRPIPIEEFERTYLTDTETAQGGL